jgi:hypothetical protein
MFVALAYVLLLAALGFFLDLGVVDGVALLGPWLGDRDEKDSRNSGPGLPVDHWRRTDDIICVWSSAATFNGHLLHRQGRHSATHSRSSLPFS